MVAYSAAEVEAEYRRADDCSVAVYLRLVVVGELEVAHVAGGGGAPAARREAGDSVGCGEVARHRRVAL